MMKRLPAVLLLPPVLLLPALLAGCGDETRSAQTGIVQTGFPGQLSAGGGTSGAVMARSPADQTTASMPAGTPGIPKGSGGNTGGTQSGAAAPASQSGDEQGDQQADRQGKGEATATAGPPPVREGRGTTALDPATATSPVPRGNVADAPPPAEQARKEKAK